ncbi:BlaI/MecI/CopY family transcriptional regulator [Geomicrobium sp. JCM 19039]|uniref:BlaI/MecI/CopY family transcriptional regulator n=1 Tax=Geomicrobium sp. JCM 19039 TaxID=1460636 RepID=UPI00045F2C2F|nr:BlaI/MecI/CopY family transcriptional regulator [Geomicrobium sp. JCM 19039]GAK13672.1 transcriptional repressor, BlaI/MecI family [Geomicrobium sp. JCM 19039]
MQKMSQSEKQIMEIIWRNEGALTTAEILQRLPDGKDWKQNTVITFLARLIEKDLVKANRMGRANHYDACLTEEEYRALETKQFISDVHKGSVSGFLQTLTDSGDLTKKDIEDLMKKLRE